MPSGSKIRRWMGRSTAVVVVPSLPPSFPTSNLELWVDASQEIYTDGLEFDRITDQTGKRTWIHQGSNFSQIFSKPRYVKGQRNGKAIYQCVDYLSLRGSSPINVNSSIPFFFWGVYNQPAFPNSYRALLGASSVLPKKTWLQPSYSTNARIAIESFTNTWVMNFYSTNNSISTGWHILFLSRNNTNQFVWYWDGINMGVIGSDSQSLHFDTVLARQEPTLTDSFVGEVGEVGLSVGTSLTSVQISDLYTYLANKWGF